MAGSSLIQLSRAALQDIIERTNKSSPKLADQLSIQALLEEACRVYEIHGRNEHFPIWLWQTSGIYVLPKQAPKAATNPFSATPVGQVKRERGSEYDCIFVYWILDETNDSSEVWNRSIADNVEEQWNMGVRVIALSDSLNIAKPETSARLNVQTHTYTRQRLRLLHGPKELCKLQLAVVFSKLDFKKAKTTASPSPEITQKQHTPLWLLSPSSSAASLPTQKSGWEFGYGSIPQIDNLNQWTPFTSITDPWMYYASLNPSYPYMFNVPTASNSLFSANGTSTTHSTSNLTVSSNSANTSATSTTSTTMDNVVGPILYPSNPEVITTPRHSTPKQPANNYAKSPAKRAAYSPHRGPPK